MLNLLRKLRKKNMKSTYFKYAIGEIVLVVVGILLALNINNWNESRKEKKNLNELVTSLINDFKDTDRLLSQAIEETDYKRVQMESFFEILNTKEDFDIDSLRKLALVFFQGLDFQPELTSYDEAKNTGELHKISNRNFFIEMTKFNKSLDFYNDLNRQFLADYSSGALWEFRKKIGFLVNFAEVNNSLHKTALKNFRKMTFEEYQKLYADPSNQASLETSFVVTKNNITFLKMMKESTQNIINELSK